METSDEKDLNAEPFFLSKPSFLQFLNIPIVVLQSGTLRDIWEKNNESFIKFFKRDMTSVFCKDTYLKTVSEKVVQTMIFDIINKVNPLKNTRCDTKKFYNNVINTHHNNGC